MNNEIEDFNLDGIEIQPLDDVESSFDTISNNDGSIISNDSPFLTEENIEITPSSTFNTDDRYNQVMGQFNYQASSLHEGYMNRIDQYKQEYTSITNDIRQDYQMRNEQIREEFKHAINQPGLSETDRTILLDQYNERIRENVSEYETRTDEITKNFNNRMEETHNNYTNELNVLTESTNNEIMSLNEETGGAYPSVDVGEEAPPKIDDLGNINPSDEIISGGDLEYPSDPGSEPIT